MTKRAIAIALTLATIAAVCAAPAMAADTAQCYAACWSTDASGKAKVAPLGATGEYAGWDEALAAIRGHNVSGYADYRFGVIVGIDAERPYEIGGDIALPANTYLVLGHTAVAGTIAIVGGTNCRLLVTEWCYLGGGRLANIGELAVEVQYAWDGAGWVPGGGDRDDPFRWDFYYPRNPDQTYDAPKEAADDGGAKPPKEKPAAGGGDDAPEEPAPAHNPFADIGEGDWFYDDVMYAYAHRLMVGTSADPMLFSPNATLTRAMVVTVLHRLHNAKIGMGEDEGNGAEANPTETGVSENAGLSGKPTDESNFPLSTFNFPLFSDVASGTWYAEAVGWAAANGIVLGYGDGRFGPGDRISRQDMAAIMHRYGQQFCGMPAVATAERDFGDRGEISEYARGAVDVLVEHGIIYGKPGNVFDPRGNATRAEFAAILHRFITGLAAEAE